MHVTAFEQGVETCRCVETLPWRTETMHVRVNPAVARARQLLSHVACRPVAGTTFTNAELRVMVEATDRRIIHRYFSKFD